ncbi:hypothetical protein Ade02nite_05850 [Paractinoplanes deccanensis]|uniref:Uncharacterized protein n=1 Tax=Paractinoplanes deccanensis TaxID=113561 RepID=A0ABQ3XW19_9ACTN|nr:hypothetical protein Ade02nite_05850 [Actinoplanes deccanensis]
MQRRVHAEFQAAAQLDAGALTGSHGRVAAFEGPAEPEISGALASAKRTVGGVDADGVGPDRDVAVLLAGGFEPGGAERRGVRQRGALPLDRLPHAGNPLAAKVIRLQGNSAHHTADVLVLEFEGVHGISQVNDLVDVGVVAHGD